MASNLLSKDEKAFLKDPKSYCSGHSAQEVAAVQASLHKKAEQAVGLLEDLLAYDVRPPLEKDVTDLEPPKEGEEERLVLGEVSSVDSSHQRILFLVEGEGVCRAEKLFPTERFLHLMREYKKIP